MAKNHRKLFPSETPSNQTQDCFGFCDPACPYNCYSSPDYYLSPPPPPLNSNSNQVNHISSYLIILVCFFIIIFVVIGFYVVKLKCYADWCGWRVNDSVSVPSDSDNSDGLNQVDHPVWLITTVGLQQSVINSITVCKYRKNEGLIEGTECSVCLNEFREDETLRLLPKCNHAFHIPCIDPWLRSHTNCPLCRAGIVSNTVASEPVVSNLGSTEPENADLGRNQDTLLDNSRNDGGVSSNLVINEESENRGGTGEPSEVLEFSDESNSKERVLNDDIQIEMDSSEQENTNLERNQETLLENSRNDGGLSKNLVMNGESENRAETGESSEALELTDGPNFKGRMLNDEIQTEMDSVSGDPRLPCCSGSCLDLVHMNSDETHLNMVNFLKQDGACAKTCKTLHRSSVEECLHMSPVCMKRSFSYNGRGYMSLKSKLNSSLLEFSIY